jgi:hypothetical protein
MGMSLAFVDMNAKLAFSGGCHPIRCSNIKPGFNPHGCAFSLIEVDEGIP